jgi:glycosyltransferase involved in cell wall biosynthesis
VFEGYFNAAGSQLVRVTERLLGRATDRIVAISTRQRDDLTSRFTIAPPEKVTVVPLGLDLAELLAVPSRPASLAGRADAPFQVGYVGRLAPIKDLATLLAGIELARRQVGSLRLTIVGDGEERAVLERRVAELGLADAVQFVGWRRDLAAVYSSMDLFALTSLNEGTPVSLIEAMAAGVPVVATAVGGVPDVVTDGTTGVLVPPRQPAALAAAIVDAVTRPSRSAHMAAFAREHVRKRFDTARLVQDTEALYLEVLARRRGNAARSATGGRAGR